MGAPVSIVLQRNERQKYEPLCRSVKTPVRLKERLTIVLPADDGLNNAEIAELGRIGLMDVKLQLKYAVFNCPKSNQL